MGTDLELPGVELSVKEDPGISPSMSRNDLNNFFYDNDDGFPSMGIDLDSPGVELSVKEDSGSSRGANLPVA